MKKPIVGVIAFGVLVLSGCMPSDQLSKSELFEKKQECIKYKQELQDRIDKDTQEFTDLGTFYSERIEEIFYSKSENSCFAITNEILQWNSGDNLESRKRIIDLLTNASTNYENDQMTYYYEKLQQLKGE